ncbi:MAG: hypothetical protein IJD92_03900 [Bacilli bacterium]|nr:hypothetical protein [Bacilli bacterium]
MKNLLKKLGVLSLITIILAPVIELPKVKAAGTGINCEPHLQNYLFLDQFMFSPGNDGTSWVENYIDDGGRTTSTYFLYAFPEQSESKIVRVTSVDQYNLDESDSYENDLKKYWQVFNSIAGSQDGMYSEGLDNNTKYTVGNVFVRNSVNKNYEDIATFLHGVWQDQDGNGDFEYAFWEKKGEVNEVTNLSFQKVLETINSDMDKMSIEILESTTGTNGDIVASNEKISSEYFNDIIQNKKNIKKIDDFDTFPISIKRQIKLGNMDATEYFNQFVFGHDDGNGNKVIYTTIEKESLQELTAEEIKTDLEKGTIITDSFNAIANTNIAENKNHYVGYQDLKMEKADFDELYDTLVDFEQGINYYWPAILAVEYETCTVAQEEIKTWNLEYDGNVSDNSVKNIPDGSSANVGESIKVSTKIPEREGYKFEKWCEDPEGKSGCYEANEEVKSDDPAEIILHAQWAEVGTTDNEKTGVMSYVIGFLTVGLIAGGIYYIVRKKNLFKQI